MSAPLYDVLVILHVVAGLTGFGALAVAGLEASKGRRSPDPFADDALARFFRPGTDWPARVLFLVPVLGLVLLLGGDRGDVPHAWPWIGLAIWVAAAGAATGLTWPAEREAQRAFGEGREALGRFRGACARMETGAAITSVCFVAAVAIMIVQP